MDENVEVSISEMKQIRSKHRHPCNNCGKTAYMMWEAVHGPRRVHACEECVVQWRADVEEREQLPTRLPEGAPPWPLV